MISNDASSSRATSAALSLPLSLECHGFAPLTLVMLNDKRAAYIGVSQQGPFKLDHFQY